MSPHEQVALDGFVVEPSFSKLGKGEHVFTVNFAHSVLITKSHREAKLRGVHEGLLQTRADESQGEQEGGLDTRRDE